MYQEGCIIIIMWATADLFMYRRTTKMYLPPEPEGQITQIDATTKRTVLLLVSCFSVKYHECKMFSPVLEKKNWLTVSWINGLLFTDLYEIDDNSGYKIGKI